MTEQILNSSLFVLLSVDLYYYFNKGNNILDEKHDNTTSQYIIELEYYAHKYKQEIIKFALLLLISALLASFYQIHEVTFLSKLYSNKAEYIDVTKLCILYFIDLTFESYLLKLNTWIIYPLKEDIEINFLKKISNCDIEKLDDISEHDLKQALDKKTKAIIASPQGIKKLGRAVTWVIINAITVSTISFTWVLQIIISTYLFLKYVCWDKLDKNKTLEKDRSKLSDKTFKSINYILQDIRSFHHFQNINKEGYHTKNLVDLTKDMNIFNQEIEYSWKKYYKLMALASKLNWIMIVLQILSSDNIPKDKIAVVLTACSYISWNFNLISNIITDTINDIASYQTYLNLLNKLNESSNLREISVVINKDNVVINRKVLQKGFNQLTGISGSGKTTFLKNIFFSQKENWDKIVILYQNSRHQFENKSPKKAIIGFKELNDNLFKKIYDCIELHKDYDKELVKPSGGEIQKMRIGMTLYEAILLNTKLLILDEPDNNIDPRAFNKIMTNIRTEFNECVILFTTHKGDLLKFKSNKIPIKEINL